MAELEKVSKELTLQRSTPDNRQTADIATVGKHEHVVEHNDEISTDDDADNDGVYLDFVLHKEMSQGFGFSVKFGEPSPSIKNVKDNSPAAVAGVQENDEIFTINEKLVENVPSTEVLKILGEDSFELRLRVKRTLEQLPTIEALPEIMPMISPNDMALIDMEMSADSNRQSVSSDEDGTLDVIVKKMENEKSFGFSMHFGQSNPVIKKINPDSAAERAALKLDDVIVGINGFGVSGMGQNLVFNLIKESIDTVQLTIKRDNIFDSSSSEDDYDKAVVVDSEEYSDIIINKQSSEQYGFGLDFTNEMPRVKTLKPHNPAERCGLLLHDEIYSINGFLVSSISEDTVIGLLRDSPTSLNLRVRRTNVTPGLCRFIRTSTYLFVKESDYDEPMVSDSTPVATAVPGLPDFGSEDIPEELIRQHEQELEQIGLGENASEESDLVEPNMPNETPKKMAQVEIDMASTDGESETTEVTLPAPMAPAQTMENDSEATLSETSTIVSETESVEEIAIVETNTAQRVEASKPSLPPAPALITVVATAKKDQDEDSSSWTSSESTLDQLSIDETVNNEGIKTVTVQAVSKPVEQEPQTEDKVNTISSDLVKPVAAELVALIEPVEHVSDTESDTDSENSQSKPEDAVNSTWTEAEVELLEMKERPNATEGEVAVEYRPSQIITKIEDQLKIIGELNDAVINEHINEELPVMIIKDRTRFVICQLMIPPLM